MKKYILGIILLVGHAQGAGMDPPLMFAKHTEITFEQALKQILDTFELGSLGTLGMAPAIDELGIKIQQEELRNAEANIKEAIGLNDPKSPHYAELEKYWKLVLDYVSFLQSPNKSGIFNVHQYRFLLNRSITHVLNGRRLLKVQAMASDGPMKTLAKAESLFEIKRGKELFAEAQALYETVKKEKDDPFNADLHVNVEKLFSYLVAGLPI